MEQLLKKQYEISVWEDYLVEENGTKYYKERMLAVIGADDIDTPNKCYDVQLRKNVNGEIELNFSLMYQYYDDEVNAKVTNPFIGYLINERKIKLKYDGQWYNFVIKEIKEDSKENVFSYTAKDLFINELSKGGYNVELSTELGNNQGTVFELGNRILESTDWEVDVENSDIIRQYVQEPLYKGTLNTNITCIDALNPSGGSITVTSGEDIFLFYSTIANKITEDVHFIRCSENTDLVLDDNNALKATNYRIDSITYNENSNCPTIIDPSSFEIVSNFQGYRLAYNQLSKYDPITEKYVDLYEAKYDDTTIKPVYHYTNYDYITSDIAINIVTCGNNFNQFQDGELQGWSDKTPVSEQTRTQKIELATYPKLDVQNVPNLSVANGIRSFLRIHFGGAINSNNQNTIFNSGFTDNGELVGSLSKGEIYGLRIKYGITGNSTTTLPAKDSNHYLRAKIAGYKVENGYYVIDKSKIYFDFGASTSSIVNNVEKGGNFNSNMTAYEKDMPWGKDVVAPAMNYYYIDKDDGNQFQYKWDAVQSKYVRKSNADLDYYLYKAECLQPLSNANIAEQDIGIFLYTKNNSSYYYWIEDIEIFKYREDENGDPVTSGNVPESMAISTDFFYLPDENIKEKEKIETFSSIDSLSDYLGISSSKITKVYNTECEKIGSIEVSESNYFNNIQELCERFECWAKFTVAHNDAGELILDEHFNPIKRVAFCNYVGKDNYAGFKYGINLESIQREVISDEIVSKLIVAQNENEYVDGGLLSIRKSKTNPLGESYILNFSYYLDKGLVDREEFQNDLETYQTQIKEKNLLIEEKSNEYNLIINKLNKIDAMKTAYTELLKTAQTDLVESNEAIREITGLGYDEYVNNSIVRIDFRIGKPPVITMSKKDSATNTWKTTTLQGFSVKTTGGTVIYPSPAKTTNFTTSTQFKILSPPAGYDYPIYEYGDLGWQITPDTVLTLTSKVGDTDIPFFTKINNTTYRMEFPLSTQDNESLITRVGSIVADKQIINSYTGLVNQITEEYNNLQLKSTGMPEYTITISTINNRTKVIISDFKDGIKLTLNRGQNSYVCTSSIVDKIFTWDEVANNFTINKLPSNYIFTNNNKKPINNTTINLNKNTTKIFYLVPNSSLLNEYPGMLKEIEGIREEKNIIEKDFLKKYNRFIQEGTWTSDDHVDNELYYLDALQVANTSAKPQVNYTINVVEISQTEGFEPYLFDVGDKTYIEDVDFFGEILVDGFFTPVREEVVVSEVVWNLDNPTENQITVQNYKTQFEDLFQRISATIQSVEYHSPSYARAATMLDANGLINSDLLMNSLNNVTGNKYSLNSTGTISIENDGIAVIDISNAANRIKLSSTGLKVSDDGGVTWNTLLNVRGINFKYLTAGTIDTSIINIVDGEQTSFRWDNKGISAFSFSEDDNNQYDFSKFIRLDKFGLYGINGIDGIDGFKPTTIEEVENSAYFGVTWNGFFIRNSYEGGGKVEITSDNDFRVLNTVNNELNEKIKIGALEWEQNGVTTTEPIDGIAPSLYGIRIKNNNGDIVMKTGDDGNLELTGTLNATAGNFSGLVNVGPESQDHIIIDGREGINSPLIQSSNYSDGAGTGWMINKDGDAYFMNITARGAIKTAVFEYAEIEAVGGLFVFRPSSTIKSARISDNDLVVKVEKPFLFETIKYTEIENPSGNPKLQGWYEQGKYGYIKSEDTTVDSEKTYFSRQDLFHSWCKISNYNSEGVEADVSSILSNNGLSHVYEISNISNGEITLKDAAPFVEDVRQEGQSQADVLNELEGGALIDFGREAGTSGYDEGRYNYGIGVNSSDNTVNLPERAISLFETVIHPERNVKVSYNLRGILGTLPVMEYTGANPKVNPLYHSYMEKTQGIYTDNMYIGDKNQYLAFYTDGKGYKHLKISARDMVFGYDEDTGEEITWEQKISEATQGSDAAQVVLTSTIGEQLVDGVGQGAVYARLYIGKQEDDPLKTFVFTTTPPDSGSYYYHLNATNKTCTLKKKVNGTWVDAPNEDQPKYNYVWTFRDESGQPTTYNGHSSITGKAIYMDGDIVNNKIVLQCDVSDL